MDVSHPDFTLPNDSHSYLSLSPRLHWEWDYLHRRHQQGMNTGRRYPQNRDWWIKDGDLIHTIIVILVDPWNTFMFIYRRVRVYKTELTRPQVRKLYEDFEGHTTIILPKQIFTSVVKISMFYFINLYFTIIQTLYEVLLLRPHPLPISYLFSNRYSTVVNFDSLLIHS